MHGFRSENAPGSRTAIWFFILSFATAMCCGVVFFTDAGHPLAIPLAYILPIALAALAVLAFRLMISGPAIVPVRPFAMGAAFWATGAWFDMLCTFISTPDLSHETNPIARTLLDSGHDCLFVVPYAVTCESLLMLSIGCLWGAFLSNRPAIIAEASRARSKIQFVKVITGQAQLSKWRWLFPLTHSHLPDMRFMVPLLAVALIAGSIYRWCLGVGWILWNLGIWFPHLLQISVALVAIVAGIVLYGISTWRAAKQTTWHTRQ